MYFESILLVKVNDKRNYGDMENCRVLLRQASRNVNNKTLFLH